MREGWVYIMASGRNGTLYTGVTSDLIGRVWQHREGVLEGFTKRYGCKWLVWYEGPSQIEVAIAREKAIKAWRRAWKLVAIEAVNPDWDDLWPGLFGDGLSPEAWLAAHFPKAG
jgi:putative endonuclease